MKGFLAAALLAIAVVLRLAALDAGWLGVDQARDLAWGERIAGGQGLPDAGPLMRNRLHLGASYYLFWALPALVSPGPHAAYAFAALLGVGAVVGAAALARSIAGDAAALAALAWLATSPVAVIDARVAWAPAALPPFCALLLLGARSLLAAPSRLKAAALGLLAALGTQLHLAAAALSPIAGVALLARARALGIGGLAVAAIAALVPLVPMALAWRVPLPAVHASGGATAAVSPYAHRIGDLVALAARWLEGLGPPASLRPAAVSWWLDIERAAGIVPFVAALVAVASARGIADRGALALVAGAFALAVGVPMLLPVEVWGYYLDAALVPAAVLVGIAATRAPWRRAGIAIVAVLCVGRALVLGWWIATASAQGFVAANLDFLRLGGARPRDPEARARLLDVAVKQAAARALGEAGVAGPRAWRAAHGPAFGDLDTDNGYFLLAAGDGAAADGDDGAPHALVLYRGELPPSWLAGFAPPVDVGPLEIRRYRPLLREDLARLPTCGGGPPPRRPVPHPLEYGAGEPRLPNWPCDWPVVEIPFDASPPGIAVRVFPRVVGAGRVAAIEVDPPGTAIDGEAPGLARGLLLGPAAGKLRLRLAIDGPAALDLVELHGSDGGAAEPRSDAPPPDQAPPVPPTPGAPEQPLG